jgi:hypothetical protein
VTAFLLICAYFTPTFVAMRRGLGPTFIIFSQNLLFGWTGVGWIWVLALAAGWPDEPKLPDLQSRNRPQDQINLARQLLDQGKTPEEVVDFLKNRHR